MDEQQRDSFRKSRVSNWWFSVQTEERPPINARSNQNRFNFIITCQKMPEEVDNKFTQCFFKLNKSEFTNKWYYLILHSFHTYMHRNSWYNLKFIIIYGKNKISIPLKHLDSIRSNQFISYPDIWYICQYCKFFNVLLVSSGNRIYSVNLHYLVHFYQISDNSVDILVCLLIILMIISLYFLFANICKLRHKKYKNYNK